MRNYQQLRVWSNAHGFVIDIYRTTAEFPSAERFGLTSQLRRAAVSIPSNIAEGAGRSSRSDYTRFLGYALGSANECEAQLLIARDLEFVTPENCSRLVRDINTIRRQLMRLRDSILRLA